MLAFLIAPASANIKRFDNYNGVITAFLSGQVELIAVGNDVGAAVLARHPAIEPERVEPLEPVVGRRRCEHRCAGALRQLDRREPDTTRTRLDSCRSRSGKRSYLVCPLALHAGVRPFE